MGIYDPDNDCVSPYVAECAGCGKEDLKKRMIAVGIKVNRYSNFNEIIIKADENNGYIATVNGETRCFHNVASAGKWADEKLHEQDTAPASAGFDLGREYKNCPICNALVPWDTMVWLDGLCTCTKCYEESRKKERYEREEM